MQIGLSDAVDSQCGLAVWIDAVDRLNWRSVDWIVWIDAVDWYWRSTPWIDAVDRSSSVWGPNVYRSYDQGEESKASKGKVAKGKIGKSYSVYTLEHPIVSSSLSRSLYEHNLMDLCDAIKRLSPLANRAEQRTSTGERRRAPESAPKAIWLKVKQVINWWVYHFATSRAILMPIERMTLRTNSRFCISWCWILTMRMMVSEYLPMDVFLKFRVRTSNCQDLFSEPLRVILDNLQDESHLRMHPDPGSSSRFRICRYFNQILHDRQSAHCKSSEVPFIELVDHIEETLLNKRIQ